MTFPDKWGPATVLLVAVAVIVVLVGGAVCIVNPDSLSFEDYLKALAALAASSGLLGVGRGLHLGLAAAGDSGAATGEPGDPDGLPHLAVVHPDSIPADEGDVGTVIR